MIYLVFGTFVLCLGTIFLIIREFNRMFERARQKWYEERQVLLNRIENPKYQPPLSAGEKQANVEEINRLRQEAEAFGLVGRIVE